MIMVQKEELMKKSLNIQLQGLFWKLYKRSLTRRALGTQLLQIAGGNGIYLSALETSDQSIYITLIFVFLKLTVLF